MNPRHLDRPGPSRGRPASTRSVHSVASTTSHLPPSALRLGPAARSLRAHTHVTLVLAHGDPLPAAPSTSSSLRPAFSGASPVEEALSRQLDRDTAGQHLSLRSRRSSAATLASMRTDYSNHLAPTEEESLPGPSRRSTSSRSATLRPDPDGPSTPHPSTPSRPTTPPLRQHSGTTSAATSVYNTPSRKINPKESSAWLRWSSPAPTFPKKDKGKGREEPDADPTGVSTRRASSLVPPAEITEASTGRDSCDARAHSDSIVPSQGPTVSTRSSQSSQPIQSTRSTQPAQSAQPPPSQSTQPPLSAPPHTPESMGQAASKAQPPQSSLQASVSSTVRGDEADVSTLLPAEPPSPAAMDSSESDYSGGKPDPTLELPPPSVRGWRIPFWSSTDPAPAATATTSESKQQPEKGPKVEPKADPNPTENHTDPEPQPSDKLPRGLSPAAKIAERQPEATVTLNGQAMRSGGDNGAKRRKLDDSAAVASKTAELATATAPSPEPATSTATSVPSQTEDRDQPVTDTASADQLTVVPTHPQPVGWGAYFASFVYKSEVTETSPTAPSVADAPEEPLDGDQKSGDKDKAGKDQSKDTDKDPSKGIDKDNGKGTDKDKCADKVGERPPSPPVLPPPVPLDQPVAASSTPQATPKPSTVAPQTEAVTPSPSPPQPRLASSTSSAGGWLSYLAFRASQNPKRITGSTLASDEARKSGETAREEVMDFSADPDFPALEPLPSNPSTSAPKAEPAQVKGKEKTAEKSELTVAVNKAPAKGKDKVPDNKVSAKVDKAASVAASEPKVLPSKQVVHKQSQNLALSDRRQSSASSVRSGTSTIPPPSPRTSTQVSAAKSNSALPAPPQAPSKQPNLVIPKFDTTFDRPPRSLMPRTAQDGVTATAWRALSYVVGSSSKDPVGETRGLKEGRDVGANLPRRIGLGGGDADDGWKNVRRVVVVGVHGWFPAKLLHSVIGEPTGTSVKFANMMGEAVKQFFKEKGVDNSEIRLTLIPLEGEGVIEDRVDKLYKAYLSNPAWINDLRRADAILFAAHSQGCIVTTHLISRMIAQGHIRTAHNRDAVARCEWAFGPIAIVPSEDSKKGRKLAAGLSGAEGGRQKVAMLAMCGVHLGPFLSISTSTVIAPYLTWFENAAARELFEFQDTESAVSQAYQRSLAMILDNEVRVLLLASLNDQVVPIYGASFCTATHPLLLRALFVDGASFSASDFMTNLICFAFMLRNAGIDDQRLVEHLSEATAGSLTGVGHSTPYEELGCYSLAVHYLFHAGPAAQPLPPLEVESFSAREGRNDFELPWIMRALVDSPEVKDLFPNELRDLKESIHTWKPTTKPLKEIKKRLEPMAGRPPKTVKPVPTKPQATVVVKQHQHLKPTLSSTSLNSMADATTPQASPHRKAQNHSSRLAGGWAENQALGTRR